MLRIASVLNELAVRTKSLPIVKRALRYVRKTDPAYWLSKAICKDNAFVVQIGSNDGKTNDPIYQLLQRNRSWSALFVEPVPYLFRRLVSNYDNDSRFRFVNAAINDGQTATFYWVDESARDAIPEIPGWFDQLGSFDRQHITKHLDGKLEPYIRSTEVVGKSLCELLSDNRIGDIDVLHIDTEGHDWQILSQLDLTRIAPQAILYEHKHLRAEEISRSIEFLNELYEIFRLGGDFLAVKRPADGDARSAFSPLRRRSRLVVPEQSFPS